MKAHKVRAHELSLFWKKTSALCCSSLHRTARPLLYSCCLIPPHPKPTSLSYPSILPTCVQLHFSFTELRSSQSHLYRQLLTYIFSGLVSPILNIQISTENNLSGTHVSSPRFTRGSHFIFLPQATQANDRKKKF